MSKEGLATDIYNVVGSEPITLYNEEGNVVYEPEEAQSMFLKKDQIMINIQEDPDVLEISLSDGVDARRFEEEYGSQLRKIAINHVFKYMLRTYGKKLTPKDFAQNTPVLENLYGSTKSSYQKIGGAKVIVRHSTAVNEEKRGARTRNIKQVFVETADGERFKIPHQNLHGARAIAYHLNSGGHHGDGVSNKVFEMVERMDELSQLHLHEQDAESKYWIRQEFLSLRECLKKSYGSAKRYKSFVEGLVPTTLKESTDFEQWALSIAPSDHLNEDYEENIVSSYLNKVNRATKATLPGLVTEMLQLGIAKDVVKHLSWPIKSMVTEAISEQDRIGIDKAWRLKVIDIKNHKVSVKDAIESIATEYSSGETYQEIVEYITHMAEESGIMPKDENEKIIDKILSKSKKLRDDLQTIKAQEFYGRAKFISEEYDQDREIYDVWLDNMREVGQGLGHRAATDQTIHELMAKYKTTYEEAGSMLERVLDQFSSK